MEVSLSEVSGRVPVTVVKITGDFSEGEPVLQAVRQAVEAGSRHILLDLSDVPFISSAGLRAIHLSYELVRDEAAEDARAVRQGIAAGTYKSPYLKLLSPTKNGMKALSVGGFDMFLEVYPNEADAIRSFHG